MCLDQTVIDRGGEVFAAPDTFYSMLGTDSRHARYSVAGNFGFYTIIVNGVAQFMKRK